MGFLPTGVTRPTILPNRSARNLRSQALKVADLKFPQW
jgi:hypothetical protein